MLIESGKDLYLIPGLFDAHVHVGSVPRDARRALAFLFVVNGVTFVRDMGGNTDVVLALRDGSSRGNRLSPEMIVTGTSLRGDDRKGQRVRSQVVCKTPDEGRRAVRKLVAKGVDQIKVHGGLAVEVYRAISEEARANGLKVVGHVDDPVGLEEAVNMGQASIEHVTPWLSLWNVSSAKKKKKWRRNHPGASPLIWTIGGKQLRIDPEIWADLMRKTRGSAISACPTLIVFDRVGRLNDPRLKTDPLLDYVPASLRDHWNETLQQWEREGKEEGVDLSLYAEVFPALLQLAKKLHDSGVSLVCGTDFAVPYLVAGFSLHEEMEFLQEAGLPPAAVLRAATLNAAKLCDVEQRLGTVVEGKAASLVLLRKNPLDNIRNTREIAGVFLNGEFYGRWFLDIHLERVRARAR
ncbi:MAG: amidohydrolase family protein [Planctomycetota bacterium]|nr:amidohydrolase family protein [Planctomycetota bacterium]